MELTLKKIKNYIDIGFNIKKLDKPNMQVSSFTEIATKDLLSNGIKYLMIDLDQTMVVQGSSKIPNGHIRCLEELKKYLGSENICFLTNEPNAEREKEIKKHTGITVISGRFRKPDEAAYMNALSHLGTKKVDEVAMIGDRVWTDIVGANKLKMFTIQVLPISPSKDGPLISLTRASEGIVQTQGLAKYFSIFLSFLTLAGMGIVEFIMFMKSIIINYGELQDLGTNVIYIAHLLFLIASNYLFFSITLNNNKNSAGVFSNPIVGIFNTYPLFFRYLMSWLFLALAFIKPLPLPDNFMVLSLFYSFIVNSILIYSLTTRYHSDSSRYLRLFLDIMVALVLINGLPMQWKIFIPLLFLVPVGTAARYFKAPFIVFVILVCSLINYYAFSTELSYAALTFSLIYFSVALLLIVEYKETVKPIDAFLNFMLKQDSNNLSDIDIIEKCATILNCKSVYFIKSRMEGYYYSHGFTEDKGLIPLSTNEEIYNYLNQHKKAMTVTIDPISSNFVKEQVRLIEEFEYVLKPRNEGKLTSFLAIKIPGNVEQYLIATNNYTRNGVARSRFTTRHARTLFLFALILSNNLYVDKDLNQLETALAQT